jgi:uncharacterized protein (TIGR00730 family)
MQRICVFCGANFGRRPAYRLAAEATGRLLAARGLGLVYGGGAVGLMGAVADAALAAGGEVIGVIPEALATKEIAHQGLSALHVVPSMHARKALMAELADGFIALPGGFGTFEELFEVLTWAQLGLHKKPIGVLDVEGYFAALQGLRDHAEAEGLVRPEHARLLHVADEPAALLAELAAARPVTLPKWISEPDT